MDLFEFLKKQMYKKCLEDHPMYKLLDFEEEVEGF